MKKKHYLLPTLDRGEIGSTGKFIQPATSLGTTTFIMQLKSPFWNLVFIQAAVLGMISS